MFRNDINIAWRNLSRSKLYAFINIGGLAVGLAGFIIILLYMNYELSYDSWNPATKRIYRVSEIRDNDVYEQTAAPLASLLKQYLPEIEAATKMQPAGDFEVLLAAGDKKIYQKGGVEADSFFFSVFPFKIVEGNAATVLNKPDAIVISRELSRKLFGDADPAGKTIRIFNAFDCEVTGVMETPGVPAYLNVQFVYRSPYEKDNLFWENYSYNTYVKTNQAVADKKLEASVNRVYYEERVKKDSQTLAEYQKSPNASGLFVDQLRKLHNFPRHGSSNFSTISVLLLLSLLLLLAGAINFSNLSIAASVGRAKEIGVKKVLGSGRKQIAWQVMIETALQCAISFFLSLVLVYLLVPYISRMLNIEHSMLQAGRVLKIMFQAGLCLLVVVLLSGLYPALFLSGYNITKVLKGDYSTGKKGLVFRNVLIVVQFTLSAFFIISTMIISKQMSFMRNRDKGFSGNQVMRLEAKQKVRDANFDLTRNALLSVPGVQLVSKTTTVPGDAFADTSTIPYKHNGTEYRMTSVKVSEDYFKTLSIPLVKGRLFANSYEDQHTRTAVINMTAARKLNLADPLGEVITFPNCDTVPVRIIGVVKDFNISGFENSVQPVVFTIGNNACMFQSGGAILVKITGGDISKTVAGIETAWKSIDPDFPIRYTFLDDNFQKLFSSYERLQAIIRFFAVTAILISITGLFALTAFLISRRTKEIGIRKVLGAGTGTLSLLLGKTFLRLVMIAVVIAIPLSWLAADKWLQHFAYRTTVGWFTFFAAALLLVFIAMLTMSIQTIKAAIANPVKSLRTE